jgi:hypothetical protein
MLDAVNPATPTAIPLTSLEVHVIGNLVGAATPAQHVAGLIYLSEQSLNQGQGIITSIDYGTGNLHVCAKLGAADQAVVQINDPNGRFGRAQSRDPPLLGGRRQPDHPRRHRLPHVLPRTDPAVSVDVLCPQVNRPTTLNPATGLVHCRDWLDAGLANNMPKGQNLRAPFPGQVYCGHLVMDAKPSTTYLMDSTQQAPFGVGDYISYAGTRLGTDGVISAHTIEAQTAIYTQPGAKPSSLAIGQFGVAPLTPTSPPRSTGPARKPKTGSSWKPRPPTPPPWSTSTCLTPRPPGPAPAGRP